MTASSSKSKLAASTAITRSLEAIRAHELEQVIALIPAASRVLEIGAGAGWQSRELANRGHLVAAIDVAGSSYAGVRVWPVREYDGFRIPFADGSFDVVFSSNTLEHIRHVEEFQDEIRRVLTPGGFAVHILPTGVWRWWSNVAHYLFVARAALVHVGAWPQRNAESGITQAMARARSKNTASALLRKAVFPPRHGESGNALSEVWLFSRLRWFRLFTRKAWVIEQAVSMRLFYTGYAVFADRLTIRQRIRLSRVLGSSSLAYVLRPTRDAIGR